MKLFIVGIISIFFITGCTSKTAEYFTLGKGQTYCEENGCDYADAGVCDSPFNIIKNKKLANADSYRNIKCSKISQ